jgi:hypothetical protein
LRRAVASPHKVAEPTTRAPPGASRRVIEQRSPRDARPKDWWNSKAEVTKLIKKLVFLLSTALLAVGLGAGTASAAGSEQAVFSIKPSFVPGLGPLGFWIWCEAESDNPYVGECAGTIYFYGTTAVEQVADQATISEGPAGIYTIAITTSDIDCSLTNETPDPRGSGQRIDISCTAPFTGSGSVVGVVNVVGG